MFTTEKFRTQVYLYYEENGITVGDPSEGNWENAHIVPSCCGGTETVLLLEEHHLAHDLYQSREYNRKTFWTGRTYKWLYGEGFLCENWFTLVELYHTYAGTASQSGLVAAREHWARASPTYLDSVNASRRATLQARAASLSEAQHQRAFGHLRVKWRSQADGFVSSASGVARHNLRLGFDPAARERIH
jgi:hypothetical protein